MVLLADGTLFNHSFDYLKENSMSKTATKSLSGTHVITKRPNGSRRVTLVNTDPVITDQAPAQELTMSSIVKKLEKGILPRFAEGLIYSTDLGVRNLQDVVDRQNEVEELYYSLHTDIRAAMGHDIKNFESVIFDPKNADLLKRHGLLVESRDQHKELIATIKDLAPHLKPSPDAQK